jgi:methylisocitrate lyase
MGYKLVIWPVSSLRVAARAQEALYTTRKRSRSTYRMLESMQTRAELYRTIG